MHAANSKLLCADAASMDMARTDIAALMQQGPNPGLQRVFQNIGALPLWIDTGACACHISTLKLGLMTEHMERQRPACITAKECPDA